MGINRVTISGNLTRDVEIRQTAGGSVVGSFGMAVNDRRRNQQTGEWEDYANFVDVVLFGNLATALQQRLCKGAKVCVEGKLRYSSWERDGQKRSKLEVIVDEIELMTQRQDGSGGGYQQGAYQPIPQQGAAQTAPQQPQMPWQQGPVTVAPVQQGPHTVAQQGIYDEDIPF